ncbi:kinesin-like protein KIF26B isoform X3 [Rhopilema esculentum]|uniref:kinesin-like protein KIF26B isoform X3 n=1 Tax=Rhopilema esculentum TaxID=499914 RepID=UPI0031E3E6A3
MRRGNEMATIIPQQRQGRSAAEALQMSASPCSLCAARLLELKRQAMKVMMIEYHKSMLKTSAPSVGSLFLAVYEQLRLPDSYRSAIERDQCEHCSTHVELLKREAVLSLHSVSIAPFLPKNLVAASKSMSGEQALNSPQSKHRPADQSVHQTAENMDARKSMAAPKTATAHAVETLQRENNHVKRGGMTVAPNDMQQQGGQAAAIFFAKAAQKFNIPAKKKARKPTGQYKSHADMAQEPEEEKQLFPTNFSRCLSRMPPSNPPGLFKYMGRRVDGKVKIMLRIAASPSDNGSSVPLLRVDQRRKQVTLSEPKDKEDETLKSLGLSSAPKLFTFDAIFESSATKTEICSSSLLDVLHSVINGGDGCLLVYGASGLGKTNTMIGKDDSTQSLGAIPCAVSWLYNLIEDSKHRTGARFSVRVSAVEIVGRSENLKDLLSEQASGASSTSSNGTSPGIYLREDPIGGVQLSNLSELRAPTADKASFFLDAALAARTTVPVNSKESLDITEHQGSHMIFTLHVYQYRIDKTTGRGGVHGGRSRLHLIDLSAWPKNSFNDGMYHSAPSQAALGKILLSMLNGTKQVSHKDSKIARLLKDSVGNLTCRTTIINHVSPDEDRYSESLATLEMASKISRSRRRKNKYCSASSSGGESSCDEGKLSKRLPRPPAIRTCGIDVGTKLEVSDYTSSAGEDSCDTVIYVGPNGRISDQDLTDNEGPPIESVSTNTNSILLPTCMEVEREPTPPPVQRKVNIVKPMPVSASSLSDASVFSDDNQRSPSPIHVDNTPSLSSTIKPRIGDFIMSDCEDFDGRRSPNFGPRIGAMIDVRGCSDKADLEAENTVSLNNDDCLPTGETDVEARHDSVFCETDEDRIDLCSAIKSSRQGLKYDINANEKLTSKDDEVIEVFVDDEQNKNSLEEDLQYGNLDENSKSIVSEIIAKTRPKVDYFQHEVDEDELSYLHMGPVTEKELRKSERRIKKLLKGGLIDMSHIHRSRDVNGESTSYMSECETDYARPVVKSERKESSGYSSAPETENRRRRIQRIFKKSFEAADAKMQPEALREESRATPRSLSPNKRLSAEETRSLLKDFVAKKIEERALSPQRVERNTNQESDFVDQTESFVPSSFAQVKYVPTCKANITSTKFCRGSLSSVQSSEANSFSPPASDTSYDKADTISMASYAGSEDRNEVPGLGGVAGRRKRSPVKIHYRWSTVFEEDERSKQNNQKATSSTDKQTPEGKKSKSGKKTETIVKPSPCKSPKVGSKMSKQEKKREKTEKQIASSSRTLKSSRLHVDDVGNSIHSVSGLSELSESSGIASNDNSSLSQHSIQCSPSGSMRETCVAASQSPISPRTRRWFFSRKPRSSGYVSDGNVTDSSRASSRSKRLFGSKSKLSVGNSSGYESMRTDNASGAESACELDGSGQRKKKRFLGFRRRSLSDLSKRGRSKRSYWIDNPASDNEGVEYTVYQIEDIEGRLSSPKSERSNMGARSNRKLLENHRRRVLGLTQERSDLETELDQAMNRLMLEKDKYKVIKGSENLDPNHPQYADELEREIGLFQKRLRVLKAHLELITCFDKKRQRKTTVI